MRVMPMTAISRPSRNGDIEILLGIVTGGNVGLHPAVGHCRKLHTSHMVMVTGARIRTPVRKLLRNRVAKEILGGMSVIYRSR